MLLLSMLYEMLNVLFYNYDTSNSYTATFTSFMSE